ncbi:MAG: COX15/CtaA family protein [Dehalococcoidia bacterium]|nr:COX15/CtaA family protein [Dehalococcoidia bacterium]
MRSVLDVRYLALLSSLATYALIVLGGTVRATNSGLACPDWPRCHGQLIPPLETNILIEYSHRLAAASVGLLIVGTAIAAWLWYRDNRFVLAGAGAAVALLIAQVLVGAVTVNMELPDTVVALHLSIALMLLAVLIATAVGAVWGQRPTPSAAAGGAGARSEIAGSAFVAALATFALILVGSYVANSGAGLVYSDWPLFNGKLISSGGRLADLHYAHRLLAVRIWRRERRPVLVAAVALALVAYVAEVLVGAVNVWLELPTSARIIHLALASAVWAALVFTLAWNYAEAGSALPEAA